MTTTPQEVKQLVLEKLGEVGAEPRQWLTQKLLIDKEGNIHSFWSQDGGLVHHQYDHIHSAISEHLHILNGYRGEMIRVRGQDFVIAGEKQRLEQFVIRLNTLVQDLISSTPLFPAEEIRLRQDVEWIIAEIGKTTNANKQLAKAKLNGLISAPLADKGGLPNPLLAIPGSEATTQLLERFIDANDKTKGTSIRLGLLLEEDYRSLKAIVTARQQLRKFIIEFQDGQTPSDSRLQQIAKQISGGKLNLITTLNRVLVKPYIDRVQSNEVRGRLGRFKKHLDKYLDSKAPKDRKTVYNDLLYPYKKLATPHRQFRTRRRKRQVVDREGIVKL